jgi:hypothetical protein
MKMIAMAVLSTCLGLAAGGALAQDAAKRAQELRNSSEMMRPGASTPERTMSSTPSAQPSEAERKAAEAREASEMMKSQNSSAAAGTMAARPSAPPTEAERKAEAERTRSEQMKPK